MKYIIWTHKYKADLKNLSVILKKTQLKLVRIVSEGHTKPSHCFAKNGKQKFKQTVMKDEVANRMIPRVLFRSAQICIHVVSPESFPLLPLLWINSILLDVLHVKGTVSRDVRLPFICSKVSTRAPHKYWTGSSGFANVFIFAKIFVYRVRNRVSV